MIRSVLALGVLGALTAGTTLAQGTADTVAQVVSDARVNLPWLEFKRVYEEKLRQELAATQAAAIAPIYSINSAEYQLRLSADGAQGSLRLSGELLRGQPLQLPLFAADLIIAQVTQAEGGTLLSDASGYRFYLDAPGSFRLDCEILLPLQEDARSPLIEFAIPAAVQNSLQLQLADGFSLLSAPGQEVQAGRYHFAPQQRLQIRFSQDSLAQAPVVDSFSRIELQDGKYRVRFFLMPRRELQQPLRISFPQARWLSASVQSSWLENRLADTSNELIVKLPPGWRQPLSLEFELDGDLEQLQLPHIVGNLGQEGLFQFDTPESTQLSLAGTGLDQGLEPQNLTAALREYAHIDSAYAQLAPDQMLQIQLDHFKTVAAPAIVLDAVYQYTSVADNGTLLSVLRLQVPPLPQRRLRLAAVSEAEVWSLTVNGEARSLYSQADSDWIIPLTDQNTLVELAYWRKLPALDLQGRLTIPTPALGLAAQSYHLAIGLPERVELVALEGELEPGDGTRWPKVSAFNGKPYYFSQPFYRGEAPSVAIHYREPLDNTRPENGS